MSEQEPGRMKSDCYSDGERGWMEYGQRLRGQLLGPMLEWLTRCKMKPDMVTLLSGLFGVAFLPLWLLPNRIAASAALILHVALDGLDGPLARHQGVASPRGSFTDSFTDQCVVTAVMIAWMIGQPTAVSIGLGTLYVFLYSLVVSMAMVRNALQIPYSWLVRPRFFIFGAIVLESMGIPWLTVPVLSVGTLLLAVKTISGFCRLRAQIEGPDANSTNDSKLSSPK